MICYYLNVHFQGQRVKPLTLCVWNSSRIITMTSLGLPRNCKSINVLNTEDLNNSGTRHGIIR